MDRVVSHPPCLSIPGSGPRAKSRVSSLPGTGGTGAVGISSVQSKKAVAVTGGITSAPEQLGSTTTPTCAAELLSPRFTQLRWESHSSAGPRGDGDFPGTQAPL